MKMKTVSNIFLCVVSLLALSWFLPWVVGIAMPTATKTPVVYFSPVDGKFVMTKTDEDGKSKCQELDTDGTVIKSITRDERDRLLPQIFYTVLSGKDEMPDSVCGTPVSIHSFKENSWVFVSNPREVNKVSSKVDMMMESMPERLELEDATEVFRFTQGGIEFVDMATNKVLPERSARFTKMMSDEGFSFPATTLNANVTSRKSYDEGYLIVDANHKLFHVKMQVGRPYVHRVEDAENLDVRHVFVMENVDHRFLGVVTDADDNAYMLEASTYALHKMPFKWNPEAERIVIMANLFNWVINVGGQNGATYYAVDNENMSLLGKFSEKAGTLKSEKLEQLIFPFSLTMTSSNDQYVYPRLSFHPSWIVLCINAVLACIVFCILRRCRRKAVVYGIMVLAFGIYVFIPAIIFTKHNK